MLVDNGDLIQGSPLGDYMAAKGLKAGETHPVYKALNTLDYAVGNLGNHEFNYGLEYLHNALAGAKFLTLTPISSTLRPRSRCLRLI